MTLPLHYTVREQAIGKTEEQECTAVRVVFRSYAANRPTFSVPYPRAMLCSCVPSSFTLRAVQRAAGIVGSCTSSMRGSLCPKNLTGMKQLNSINSEHEISFAEIVRGLIAGDFPPCAALRDSPRWLALSHYPLA